MHMVRFQCEHKQDKTIHRIEVCEKYKLSTTLHLLKKKNCAFENMCHEQI